MALVRYDVPQRSRHCALQKEELAEGTDYYSLLTEEDEGFQRQDFCVACWKASASSIAEDATKKQIYWKARVPLRVRFSDKSLRRDEKALLLLKEICREEGEEAQVESYVLALLLARKKRLQLRQELKGDSGDTVLFYEATASEEMFCVRKLDVAKIDSSAVQRRIAAKLALEE